MFASSQYIGQYAGHAKGQAACRLTYVRGLQLNEM